MGWEILEGVSAEGRGVVAKLDDGYLDEGMEGGMFRVSERMKRL